MNNSCTIQKLNKPIPSFKNSPVQNTAKSKTFVVKRSFVCIRIKKTQFHINGFALSLALKQRFWQLGNGLLLICLNFQYRNARNLPPIFCPKKIVARMNPFFITVFKADL